MPLVSATWSARDRTGAARKRAHGEELEIRVHRALGPGLYESVYEQCLAYELDEAKLNFRRQVRLPVEYRGTRSAKAFAADFIIEEAVLVELKCVAIMLPIDWAQVVTYLRLAGLRKGLLLNFNTVRLKDGGITSIVL